MRLAANPNSQGDLGWQALLRAHLGDRASAETSLRLYEQMGESTIGGLLGGHDIMVDTCVTLGRYDQALDEIAAQLKMRQRFGGNFGYLHFSPELNPMRDNPRFKALLARVDAANPNAAARLHEAAKRVLVLPAFSNSKSSVNGSRHRSTCYDYPW